MEQLARRQLGDERIGRKAGDAAIDAVDLKAPRVRLREPVLDRVEAAVQEVDPPPVDHQPGAAVEDAPPRAGLADRAFEAERAHVVGADVAAVVEGDIAIAVFRRGPCGARVAERHGDDAGDPAKALAELERDRRIARGRGRELGERQRALAQGLGRSEDDRAARAAAREVGERETGLRAFAAADFVRLALADATGACASRPLDRAVLARAGTGDSHALDDGRSAATLVLSTLADRKGLPRVPAAAGERRALLARHGVVSDPLSSPRAGARPAAPRARGGCS